MEAIFKEQYGYLFEPNLLDDILEVGVYKEVPAGAQMMEIGDYIKSMPLLLEGAIKIMREDENGDELLLYFLERGDTCAMTMTCCLGNTKSKIRAVVEQDAKLILIPVQMMEEWLTKYRTWRSFVFESYDSRFNELLSAIDTLAFQKMDERLYRYLKDKSMILGSPVLDNTHHEIARDLHTSRVVVSRLLKKLENESLVRLNRNKIEVLQFKKR